MILHVKMVLAMPNSIFHTIDHIVASGVTMRPQLVLSIACDEASDKVILRGMRILASPVAQGAHHSIDQVRVFLVVKACYVVLHNS